LRSIISRIITPIVMFPSLIGVGDGGEFASRCPGGNLARLVAMAFGWCDQYGQHGVVADFPVTLGCRAV